MNFIISGKRGFGKTTVAQRLATLLKEKGLRIGGVLNIGNTLTNLLTNKTIPFTCTSPMPNSIKIGQYYILTSAFTFAEEAIKESIEKKAYTFIDECGKLELQKKQGFYDILTFALPQGNCIVCVRDANVKDFFEVFHENEQTTKVFLLDKTNRDNLSKEIADYITAQR